MDEAAIWELVLPYLKEILSAVTIFVVTGLRLFWQKRAAVDATEYAQRQGGNGASKKVIAEGKIADMPRFLRPMTDGGVEKLIERAVPAGQKRVSLAPQE